MNNNKRVSLNRSRSSLVLDYQAMVASTKEIETNDYTKKLLASALNLPQPKHTEPNLHHHHLALKPSLRNPTRSISAPSSPSAITKSVTFHQQLEDVCLFRKAQTPLAISQKNIFWAEDESSSSSDEDGLEYERSLNFINWSTSSLNDVIDKNKKTIRIEKNNFKLIQDEIVGKIMVKNLDYHKKVTIRYSFDFWETFHNLQADFYEAHKTYDVFEFRIQLPSSTCTQHLYFAVNYKVGPQDHWDNNDGRNYEIQIISKQIQDTSKEDMLKSRYDFSNSIHQAKSSVISPTLPPPIPVPRRSSPSCNSPVSSSSPSLMDLNSQSYLDLVNKYCFYSTSPSRSPMSING